jgi:hypothetical protein
MRALMFVVLSVVGAHPDVVAGDEPPCLDAASPYVPHAPMCLTVWEPPYYEGYSRNRHSRTGTLSGYYPTFREAHYVRPYHYRNLFDYPWHEDQYRWTGVGCAAPGEVFSPLGDPANSAEPIEVEVVPGAASNGALGKIPPRIAQPRAATVRGTAARR